MGRQNIQLTTDCVIFCRTRGDLKVLLIEREKEPFKGNWALPGGFLEDEEALEEGARRELQEETGLVIEKLTQIRAFGAPKRDPRGRTVSIGFLGMLSSEEEVVGNDDAAEAKWFEINSLPKLAFDHQEILDEALNLLRSRGRIE